jgi:2-iminobutanoate/2-iminopropanoate deaminase
MGVTRHPSTFASYSESVVIDGPGRWIYVAGQVGMDDAGNVEGDLTQQSHATLDRIARALEPAGASLAHVVKLTVSVTDLADYAQFSAVRAERFGETLPASSAVQVADLLLGAAIEIDAVAFVPERTN